MTLADAGYVDCSGSVVARLLTGVLIGVELSGLGKRVSRWPGHAALLCSWWKGHSDLIHPGVVLAACALACVFFDQGIRWCRRLRGRWEMRVSGGEGVVLRAPDEYMLARRR